jgi:hypothetical protein
MDSFGSSRIRTGAWWSSPGRPLPAVARGAYNVRLFAIPVKLDTAVAGLEIPDKPNPEYWRDRARITRANADRETNPRVKLLLLAVADSYERLAERIKKRKSE